MPLTPGYDRNEAISLLSLCAFVEEGAPQPPIPDPRTDWDLQFDSPVMGSFDNKWQLWRKKNNGPFAIALRGTVNKTGSILEDLISLMAKAEGALTVSSVRCDYKFAADPEAGVHLGFALGTLLLVTDPANGILAQLARSVPAGSEVYITGHSQGAAMATLLRSYLHYAAAPNHSFKTYVYAQPKPGNDHYAEEFEALFCTPGLAFRVTNTLDWVAQVPFTLQFPQDIDKPNPLSVAAPSVLVAIVTKALSEVRGWVETHTRSHFQAQAAAVAQQKPEAQQAPGGAQALAASPFAADFLATLDFVNAGSDCPLAGVPCAGAQCQDALFEHHATTYFALLSAAIA